MNFYLTFSFIILVFPYVLSDELSPFYQFNDVTGWSATPANPESNISCQISSDNYEIFGGPKEFNLNTVITKRFTSQQNNATFYKMNINFKLFQLDYSKIEACAINFQILLHDVAIYDGVVNNSNLDPCENLLEPPHYLKSFNLIYLFNQKQQKNLSTFNVSMRLKSFDCTPADSFVWGVANLTTELFECDTSLCSSCSMLPRNCTSFCSIKCKTCIGNNPNHCSSCFEPNKLNESSGLCESSSIINIFLYIY